MSALRLLRGFPDAGQEAAFLQHHRADSAQVARFASLVALVMMLLPMAMDSVITPLGYRATNIRIYLIVPSCLLVWYASGQVALQRWIEPIAAALCLVSAAAMAAIFLVYEPGFYGLSGAIAEGNFIMILMAVFTLSYLRLKWAMGVAAGVIAIYTAATCLWSQGSLREFFIGHFVDVMLTFVLGSITCGMLEVLRRRQYQATSELQLEKERYKELLYNLVPSQIAARIEEGEFPIADSQAEIAVLFSDLVGFTGMTKQLAPHLLVQMLNELFSQFDDAAHRHGVEKIKTVGDGYMAACGPPVSVELRTVQVVRLGLEMVAITRALADKYQLEVNIRVGVHCGSLVSGVIGKSRYTYDMWGESVNMASRMESAGLPNRVQVSEPAFRRLAGHFDCEGRGDIDVRGIGNVKAWLVEEEARSNVHPLRAAEAWR